MSVTFVASAIVLVIIAALVISSISYTRQKALMARQKRLNQYKQAVVELAGYQQTVLRFDPEYSLLITLQKQLISNLIHALEVKTDDNETIVALSQAKAALNNYQQKQRTNEVNQEIDDPEEHKRTKIQFSAISKMLDLMMNRGEISGDKRQLLGDHIKFLQLEVDVKSYRKQAHIFSEQGERILHQQHLKLARDALTKSPIQFDEKNDLIRELSEELSELKRTNKIVQDAENPNSDNAI